MRGKYPVPKAKTAIPEIVSGRVGDAAMMDAPMARKRIEDFARRRSFLGVEKLRRLVRK